MFRQVALTEWLWWGGAALFLMALGIVANQLRRTHTAQRALEAQSRDAWERLTSPLAGGSVWGSRRPSLALRIALLYFGVMALSICTSPIVGLLLLFWSATLWVAVYLEKSHKQSPGQ